MQNSYRIQSLEQLRALIPQYNPMLDRRIQPRLDHLCREFIMHATFAVFSRNSVGGAVDETVFALLPLTGTDNRLLTLCDTGLVFRLGAEADHNGAMHGNGSLYFLAAGLGHGLRVNGRYRIETGTQGRILSFSVAGAYLHCARAATRADIWNRARRAHETNQPESQDGSPLKSLLADRPYAVLHTCNAEGITESSPRGGDGSLLQYIDEQQVFLPERPGNKVAVSLRNILEWPVVSLCLLSPGASTWLEIRGAASLRMDPEWLEASAVNGKAPRLGILVRIAHWRLRSGPLSREVWFSGDQPDPITPFSKALAEHMQGKGLMGKLTHLVVDGVVKKDMRNLY